jgi:branched-chain amino acid aminotransferase
MAECFGDWFVLNGRICPAVSFSDSLIYEGESIYEVLRLVNGIPYFFHDHMERLESGTRSSGKVSLRSRRELRDDISELLKVSGPMNVNLRIVFNYRAVVNNCLLFYTRPAYPTVVQYTEGVKGILFDAERPDPTAKLFYAGLRAEINRRLNEEGAYEAVLVNRQGCITEGSRSNIFFVSGNELVTAPDELVLGGITRKQVLKICNSSGIRVSFKCVRTEEMPEYTSALMTGTTPVVIPYHSVGSVSFNVSDPLIPFLRSEYLKRAGESLGEF